MKFTEYCKHRANNTLTERRHFMRHSVESNINLPVPQSVLNVLNTVKDHLQPRMMHWIFTEGVRLAVVRRRNLAKKASQELGVEVPQDGLFAEKAMEEIPGLAEYIEENEPKWMVNQEPDIIQLPGKENGAKTVSRVSLKNINAILIRQGMTPLYFGGRNGLVEYIEKGDWKKGVPRHKNPYFEKHGINLSIDDDSNGLKEDENGKTVLSLGLDPSHGIDRNDTPFKTISDIANLINDTGTTTWRVYKTEPDLPNELRKLPYFQDHRPSDGAIYYKGLGQVEDWLTANEKKLTSITLAKPDSRIVYNKEGDNVWREPKEATYLGSYQVPNTKAEWRRAIEDAKNSSFNDLDQIVDDLQNGLSIDEIKNKDSEMIQKLLVDGTLTRDSFETEKSLLRDAMRINGRLRGVKKAAGTDEDWIAAKAIVKQNLKVAMKKKDKEGKVDPFALGDSTTLNRASIKINNRDGISLEKYLPLYKSKHGGIDFNSDEFKAQEDAAGAKIDDITAKGEALRDKVADALVHLIFNDEDRTVASSAKIRRGAYGGDAGGRNMQINGFMATSGKAHDALKNSSNLKPIDNELIDLFMDGWLVKTAKAKTQNLGSIEDELSPTDYENIILRPKKNGADIYIRGIEGEFYLLNDLNGGKTLLDQLTLSKGGEDLQLRKEKNSNWNIVEDDGDVSVEFNGEKVSVKKNELLNNIMNSKKRVFRSKTVKVENLVPVSTKDFDLDSHINADWKIYYPKGIKSFDDIGDSVKTVKISKGDVYKKILVRKDSKPNSPWVEAIPKEESNVDESDIMDLINNDGFVGEYMDEAQTIAKVTNPKDPEEIYMFKRKFLRNPKEGEKHHQWFAIGIPDDKTARGTEPITDGLSTGLNTGQGSGTRISANVKQNNANYEEFLNSIYDGEAGKYGEEIARIAGQKLPSSLVKAVAASKSNVLTKGTPDSELVSWGQDGQRAQTSDIAFMYGVPEQKSEKDDWKLGEFLKDEGGTSPNDFDKIYEFYIDQLFKKRKKAKVYDGKSDLKEKEVGEDGKFIFGIDDKGDPVFSQGVYNAIMHHGWTFRKRIAQNEIINQAKKHEYYKSAEGAATDEKSKRPEAVAKDKKEEDEEEEESDDNEEYELQHDDEEIRGAMMDVLGDNDDDGIRKRGENDSDYNGEEDDEDLDSLYDPNGPSDRFDNSKHPEIAHAGSVGANANQPKPQNIPAYKLTQKHVNMSNLRKSNARGTVGNGNGDLPTERDDAVEDLGFKYNPPTHIRQRSQALQRMRVESRNGFRRWLVETGPYDPKISKSKDRTFNVWGSPPEGEVPQKSIDGEVKTIKSDPTGSKGVKSGRSKKA